MKKRFLFLLLLVLSTRNFAQSQNNGLNFDGVDDYVDLNVLQNDFYNSAGAFTIEFWMLGDLNDQTSSIRTCMFSINEPTGENRLLMIMGGALAQDGHLMLFEDGSWGANPIYTSTDIIGDNNCHHIAYSYDGTTGRVYIDGVLKDEHVVSYGFTPNDRFSLGQEYDNLNTSQFYNGELDDLRIWGVVRNQTEIQANMSIELSGTETGLLAYYNFNQGISNGLNPGVNTLNDVSGNAMVGDLYNFQLQDSVSNWVRPGCTNMFVGIEETQIEEVELNIYPNPTADFTVISFELTASTDVLVTLNDLSGKTIQTIENSEMSEGFQEFELATASLRAGVYLVSVRANNRITNKKLTVVK